MTASNWMMVAIGQLAGQIPLLLVYVGGIIAAAALSRRSGLAATLAIFGLAVLLLVAVGAPMIQNYLVFMRSGGTMTSAQMGQVFFITGIVFSFLRAGGTVLLLIAVFVGRESKDRAGFDVAMREQ